MAYFRCGISNIQKFRGTAVDVTDLPSPIASFRSNASGVKLDSLKVLVEAVQSGSGTPSPDNVRPITGWSGANVCDTPMPVAPLWNIDSSFNGHVEFNQLFNINGTIGKNNGTVDVTNNVLTFTTTYKSTYQYINQSIAFPQNHKFLISVDITLSQNETVAFGDGSTIFNATAVLANTKTRINRVFNYSNARASFYLYPGRSGGLDIGSTMVAENFLVIDLTQMFGSTIADYIYSLEQGTAGAGVAFFRSIYPNNYYAYDTGTDEMVGSREGNTYTISFGDTYYGGELDVTSGVLRVTQKLVDMGTANWEGSYYQFTIPTPSEAKGFNGDNLCSIYPRSAVNNTTPSVQTDKSYIVRSDKIYVKDTDYNGNLAGFKTAMAGQKLVFELATPFTIQLSPQQIEQLEENNIWADTGDVSECKYIQISQIGG